MKDRKGLFSLSSASISLDIKLGLKFIKAAICIKESSGNFRYVLEEIKGFLNISKELSYNSIKDRYGYVWFIINAKQIESLIACIDAISEIITEHGFQYNILAAVFKFANDNKVYLLYRFKENKFYPFIPSNNSRNIGEEMKIYALMKDEIPMESDMEKWYPIWDMPL